MENNETTNGQTVPVLYKKHYSIEDYIKKIAPETILKFQDDLEKSKKEKE